MKQILKVLFPKPHHLTLEAGKGPTQPLQELVLAMKEDNGKRKACRVAPKVSRNDPLNYSTKRKSRAACLSKRKKTLYGKAEELPHCTGYYCKVNKTSLQ